MRLTELAAANDILADPAAVARRYRDDGCLLVRNAVDAAVVDGIAGQVATLLRRWDVATPAAAPGPRWTGQPPDRVDLAELEAVPALVRLIDGFGTDANPVRAFVDRVCGHRMYLWRNACLFVAFPDDPAYATRPHQDSYALSADGDYRRVWIALTPVPFGDGGLAVALGSHRAGRLPLREFPVARFRATADAPASTAPVRGVDPALVDDHWHTAAFQPGDALIFHSDLVHRGLPATSDRIRLALGMVASRDGDPRPSATFSKTEIRSRNRRLRALGEALGLAADEVTRAGLDLIMTGLPVTDRTLRAALAGDHAAWRRHAPAQVAARAGS